jgi:hypothetical protein
VNSPRRRSLLGAVGLYALGLSAGCTQSERRAETRTTERCTSTEGVGDTETTTPDSKRVDDLFLQNERSDDVRLDLRVSRGRATNCELLLYNRYEVPGGAKLEIPNLGVVDEWYTVEVRLADGAWQTFEWAVVSCERHETPTQNPQQTPEDDPTMNADAVVEIREDGFEFLRNECDAIALTERGAVPASEYVVWEYLGTSTTA